jgi:hypothetical protein
VVPLTMDFGVFAINIIIAKSVHERQGLAVLHQLRPLL